MNEVVAEVEVHHLFSKGAITGRNIIVENAKNFYKHNAKNPSENS